MNPITVFQRLHAAIANHVNGQRTWNPYQDTYSISAADAAALRLLSENDLLYLYPDWDVVNRRQVLDGLQAGNLEVLAPHIGARLVV